MVLLLQQVTIRGYGLIPQMVGWDGICHVSHFFSLAIARWHANSGPSHSFILEALFGTLRQLTESDCLTQHCSCNVSICSPFSASFVETPSHSLHPSVPLLHYLTFSPSFSCRHLRKGQRAHVEENNAKGKGGRGGEWKIRTLWGA